MIGFIPWVILQIKEQTPFQPELLNRINTLLNKKLTILEFLQLVKEIMEIRNRVIAQIYFKIKIKINSELIIVIFHRVIEQIGKVIIEYRQIIKTTRSLL